MMSDKPQTITPDAAEICELPGGAPRRYKARSPWAADASQPALELRAGRPYSFHLEPFQVLTLEAQPQ